MYPSDMAWWLLNILVHGTVGMNYNVGSPESITLQELAEKIAVQVPKPPKIISWYQSDDKSLRAPDLFLMLIVQQGAGNGEPLLHPARKRPRSILPPIDQIDLIQQFDDPRFELRHIIHLAEEAQILLGGQIAVEQRLMRQQADLPPGVIRAFGQRVPGDGDVPVRGTAQRGQDAQQRRLACAIRPDDGDKFAGPDFQVKTAQGHERAELFGEGVSNDQ